MPDVFLKKDTDVISTIYFNYVLTRKSEKEIDMHHIISIISCTTYIIVFVMKWKNILCNISILI